MTMSEPDLVTNSVTELLLSTYDQQELNQEREKDFQESYSNKNHNISLKDQEQASGYTAMTAVYERVVCECVVCEAGEQSWNANRNQAATQTSEEGRVQNSRPAGGTTAHWTIQALLISSN